MYIKLEGGFFSFIFIIEVYKKVFSVVYLVIKDIVDEFIGRIFDIVNKVW